MLFSLGPPQFLWFNAIIPSLLLHPALVSERRTDTESQHKSTATGTVTETAIHHVFGGLSAPERLGTL